VLSRSVRLLVCLLIDHLHGYEENFCEIFNALLRGKNWIEFWVEYGSEPTLGETYNMYVLVLDGFYKQTVVRQRFGQRTTAYIFLG